MPDDLEQQVIEALVSMARATEADGVRRFATMLVKSAHKRGQIEAMEQVLAKVDTVQPPQMKRLH